MPKAALPLCYEKVFKTSSLHPSDQREARIGNHIIFTTLATRAAIEGGVDPDTAFHLSDNFIETAEKLSAPDALNELIGKIYLNTLQPQMWRSTLDSAEVISHPIF